MSEDIDVVVKYKSVTELMHDLKASLIALIPVFDAADIPWSDSENYELLEEIAGSLFNGIVGYTIEKYFNDGQDFESRFAKYSFYYKDYSNKSFIEIINSDTQDNKKFIFVALSNGKEPFDTILYNIVNSYGKIEIDNVEMPFESAQFAYRHRDFSGQLTQYEELK